MSKVVIGNAELYLGDCRDILPSLQPVDAMITDPPYGTGFVGGYNRAGETILNDADLVVVEEALRRAHSVCKGNALVFYSPRVAPEFHRSTALYDWAGGMVWDKKAPGMGGGLRYQHECIAVFGDISRLEGAMSVLTFYRSADEHPHQKPDRLMEMLIGKYRADSVLDPFMGSGSTGVASLRLGRSFVGIELDPRFFDIACERISRAAAQEDLFVVATRPEQADAFGQGGS